MLTLHATDDFASWYGALNDEDAEEVAHGMGLIEALGPERPAPGSSDMLLWYQSSPGDLTVLGYGEHSTRLRQIIQHLQSHAVQQRMRELESERSNAAHNAIGALIVRARWRHLFEKEAWVDVQAKYQTVLDALGLEEPAENETSTALRQLDFCKRPPGVRVVYGVDAPRSRALLVLGESLGGTAYGPSVRKALRVWSQFLRGDAEVSTEAFGSTR